MQGTNMESPTEALNELINVASILEDNHEFELSKIVTEAVDTLDDEVDG